MRASFRRQRECNREERGPRSVVRDMLTLNVSIFVMLFLTQPSCYPPSPNIALARGSNVLRIIWFEKGSTVGLGSSALSL